MKYKKRAFGENNLNLFCHKNFVFKFKFVTIKSFLFYLLFKFLSIFLFRMVDLYVNTLLFNYTEHNID